MAKIKLWTNHNGQRDFVLECKGNVTIDNEGVVSFTLPKKYALMLGFKDRYRKRENNSND